MVNEPSVFELLRFDCIAEPHFGKSEKKNLLQRGGGCREVTIRGNSTVWNDAQREIKVHMPYANGKGPDRRAYLCSLLWAYQFVDIYYVQYPLILLAGNEGPDQPAQLRRLIRTCVVRNCIRALFVCYASNRWNSKSKIIIGTWH